MLTTEQIRNRTKTVTRRVGWHFLEVGNVLQAIEKGQGLKKGEKVNRLAFLKVEGIRREPLVAIVTERDGCKREGFPKMDASEFVTMFCRTHKGCQPHTEVTRIQFSYVEPEDVAELERIDRAVTALNKWGDKLIASGAVKFIEL